MAVLVPVSYTHLDVYKRQVMVRQMLRKVRVMDPGDTDLLPGTLMDISDFTDANKDIVCLLYTSK